MIFEQGEKLVDENGVTWISLYNDNTFPPHIWREGWMREEDMQPTPPEPLTIEQIKTRHFISEALGVPFELSPQDTYVLSLEADLPPIADGKEWKAGLNLAIGTIVTFGGSNYQVVQPHISQADWKPTLTPALFKQLRDPYADWVQPMGVHDAYMMDDVVMHNDAQWRSDIDHNVWEPGVFGWSLA